MKIGAREGYTHSGQARQRERELTRPRSETAATPRAQKSHERHIDRRGSHEETPGSLQMLERRTRTPDVLFACLQRECKAITPG